MGLISITNLSTGVETPLGLASGEVLDFVRRNLRCEDVVPWTKRPAGIGRGFEDVASTVGSRPTGHVMPNTFRWPTGASRWAYGFFLADSDMVDAIRDAAYAYGRSYFGVAPVLLTLRSSDQVRAVDDDGKSLKTRVFVADIRAISGERGHLPPYPRLNQMSLLTVADERWLWQFLPFEWACNGEAELTWNGLVDACGATIRKYLYPGTNWGISRPPVDPSYALPDRSILQPGRSLPYVIDAIGWNLGWKFVRRYDGTCTFQRWTDAYADLAFNARVAEWQRTAGDFKYQPTV
jgi:hypothetical protein